MDVKGSSTSSKSIQHNSIGQSSSRKLQKKSSSPKPSPVGSRSNSEEDVSALAEQIITSNSSSSNTSPSRAGRDRASPENFERKKSEDKRHDFSLSAEALTIEKAQILLDKRDQRLEEIEAAIKKIDAEILEHSKSSEKPPEHQEDQENKERQERHERRKARSDLLNEKNSLSLESIDEGLNLTKNALKIQRDSFKKKSKLTSDELELLNNVKGHIQGIRDFQKKNNLGKKNQITNMAIEGTVTVLTGIAGGAETVVVGVASNIVPVTKTILSGVGNAAVYLADSFMGWFKD